LAAGASFELGDEPAATRSRRIGLPARVRAHESSATITTVASPTVGGSVANSRQAPSALFASAPPSPGFPDPSRPRRERLLSPELGNSEANSENSNHLRCPYKTANYLHTATLYSRCCRFKSGGGLLSLLEEEALIPQAVLFEPL
jgi:hypothetical protein